MMGLLQRERSKQPQKFNKIILNVLNQTKRLKTGKNVLCSNNKLKTTLKLTSKYELHGQQLTLLISLFHRDPLLSRHNLKKQIIELRWVMCVFFTQKNVMAAYLEMAPQIINHNHFYSFQESCSCNAEVIPGNTVNIASLTHCRLLREG